MSNISELAGKNLVWAQAPGEKKRYELRDGDTIIGTLSITKEKIEGQIGDAKWTFSREGFFRPRLTVQKQGEDKPCATLEVGALASGRLLFEGKEMYHWTQQGMLSNHWGFAKEGKNLQVDFTLEAGLLTTSAQVTFQSSVANEPTTPLLLVLGWFVLLLYAEDVLPAGL